MAAPLSGIPANLVTGPAGVHKAALLSRLLALRPAQSRWALLLNDRLAAPANADGLHVAAVAEGCICCTAQLPLRVALTRLLRESRPERVLIVPSAQARSADILRQLGDGWLAPVLDLRSVWYADSPGSLEADTVSEQRARADVVVTAPGMTPPARLEPEQKTTGADGLIDAAWLDIAHRPAVTPRFHRDG